MNCLRLLEALTLFVVTLHQTSAVCPSLDSCTLTCPYGFQTDANLCSTCACFPNPCQGYACGATEVCKVRIFTCFVAPCPQPTAMCVAEPASTPPPPPTTPTPDLCLLPPVAGLCSALFPRYFFNVSALQCQQFSYGGCGGNGNNFLTSQACLARCLPTAAQPTQCPPISPCASSCQLQLDSNQCNTCVCPGASCQDVTCDPGQQCEMVPGICPFMNVTCSTRPQCVTTPTQATVSTLLPIVCPYMECELKTCQYGFNIDANGCQICSCFDPCASVVCPAGQTCMVAPSDCSGSNCRDAPGRYCADITTTTTVTAVTPIPAANLLQCCQDGGVQSPCLSLCVSNLTVTSSNVPTLLQCTDDLAIYLQCVGGGHSFTSCCSKKGVGSNCMSICSETATVDISNMHLYTQCLMSPDLNSVFACYQTGMPDPSTAAPSTTPSTTPKAMLSTNPGGSGAAGLSFCALNFDVGTCDSLSQRWYYDQATMTCQQFFYSGCGGNQNNFASIAECLAACQPSAGCPPIACTADGCSLALDTDGCPTCSCGVTTTTGSSTSVTTDSSDALQSCCQAGGVSTSCLQFCTYSLDATADSLPALLGCESYVDIGIQCAKQGESFTTCCQNAGVSGGCITSCSRNTGITNLTCLITDYSAMLQCFQFGQPDPPCPSVQCSNRCQYGFAQSAQGCNTCSCYDPCQNNTCTASQTCTYAQVPICTGDACQMTYVGQCVAKPIVCPAALCSTNCSYGYVKDSLGCDTCVCFNPCQGVTCASGTSCNVDRSLSCNGGACTTQYSGVCMPDCNLEDCSLNCTYGLDSDANGCAVCQCHDPCENVTCSAGMVCNPQTLPTVLGSDSGVKQVYIGQCESVCPVLPPCMMYCRYGALTDANGCTLCKCYDPCLNNSCTANQTCGYKSKQTCTADFCETTYTAECIDTTVVTCPTLACATTTNCSYGFAKDSTGCDTCTCLNPCQGVVCAPGSTCQVNSTQACQGGGSCKTQYSGACAPLCSPLACSLNCSYGLNTDANGCQICQCYDPCKGVACSSGMACKPQVVPVPFGSNAHAYIGQCQSVCPSVLCMIYCPYGALKNANGCTICKCNNPCQNVTCDTGSVCTVVTTTSPASANLNTYQGVCTPRCPALNCRMYCPNGFVFDQNQCEICACYDPCQNVSCGAGLQCAAVAAQVTDSQPYPTVGQCVSASVTPTCNPIICALTCTYGLMKDSNGCNVCQCYQPCQGVQCDLGFGCSIETATPSPTNPYTSIGVCKSICSPVMCNMFCQYGFVKDNNGCDTCHCYDPCQNVTCGPASICQRQPVNTTATQLYSYQAQCVSCTGMACKVACQYGIVMLTANCPLCQCFDPCKAAQCSSNAVCVPTPSNVTASNLQTFSGVCIDSTQPCFYQRAQNSITYQSNLNNSPQLNCDNAGYYKPLQCTGASCSCVSQDGTASVQGLSLTNAIQTCYPTDIITGTLKMYADIGIIGPGQGSEYKQQVSSQMANMFSMSDSDVTITTYQSGSIISDFVVACPDFGLMNTAEDTLEDLGSVEFTLMYNGVAYQATVLNYTRLPFATPVSGQTDRVAFLLKVILIPILGSIVLGIIIFVIVFCSCKHCREQKKIRLPESNSSSNRNSINFIDTAEKGHYTANIKAGYDNPVYDGAKDQKNSVEFNPPTIKSVTSA